MPDDWKMVHVTEPYFYFPPSSIYQIRRGEYVGLNPFKAMGSPPESKAKQCSMGVFMSVIGAVAAALVLSAVATFFITRHFYTKEDHGPGEEALIQDQSPLIDDLLLPKALRPDSYDLSMKVYLPGYVRIPKDKEFTFEGQVKIEMDVMEPVRKITLNAKNLTISLGKTEITQNGKSVKVKGITMQPELDKVFFELDDAIHPGESVEMKIVYTGAINEDLGGLYQTAYNMSDGAQVIAAVTQMQAMNARKMVPCFDEPAYKATWKVSVIHPKGTTAIANGIEEGKPSTVDSDFISTHFETTPKMSSYLLALFISEFKYLEDFTKNTKTPIRFRIWSRPEATNMTKYALAAGIKCIEFYEKFYETEFPLKKQDMVALPDFGAGAMENWGLITYRENSLLYDEKLYKPSEKLRVATVIAHELAHQWFGNLVTMEWWEDLWLNEGFATLVEYLGTDEISDKKFKMEDYFLVDAFNDAMKNDETASSHPLTHRIDHSAEIDESFDGITYQKGGSILAMIRATMGEENFNQGVRNYLKEHSFSNAAAADLLRSFDAAVTNVIGPRGGKLNVTEFARKWTHQMGFPYITMQRFNATHSKVMQKRYKLDPAAKEKQKFASPEYKFKWDIPVWIQRGQEVKPKMEWLRDDEDLIIKNDVTPIVLNADAHAFVRMNYQKDDWKEIFDQLKKNHNMFSTRTRFAIVSDAFAMAEIGELSYEQLFDLFDYIHKETEYMPWSAFRMQFSGLLHYFGTEPESKQAEEYLLKRLKTQFDKTSVEHISANYKDDSKFFENLHEAATYLTYCDYNKTHCKQEMRDMYETKVKANCEDEEEVASECNTVAPPLRFIVYCRAVEYGEQADFDFIMNLYKKEPVQIERNKLMDALSCTRNPRTLKTLLSWAVDRSANIFRFQDVSTVFGGVAFNEVGRELVFNFLLEHWNDIYSNFNEVHDTINRIISSCAGGIRTKSQLDQLKHFHKTAENAAQFDSFRVQALAAEQRLKWMDTHLKPLSKLFKDRL